MNSPTQNLNPKQLIYREMVFGTLVYSVVLGFFNDYTDILRTESYSTTFSVAIVLQVLTYLTLGIKKRVSDRHKGKVGLRGRFAHVLSVWLVLFLSKFVFLAAIDLLFGQAVRISGFVGLLVIILVMTVSKQLIDFLFERLGDQGI